jgi:hypothetical protein
MAFEGCPRCAFSEAGIAKSPPRASGIYAIYNGNEWIYVAETGDIQARLYEHFCGESDESASIARHNPAGFTYELCDAKRRKARKAAIVRELRPVF